MTQMLSLPALPIIKLVHGAWSADVFDPRLDPLCLGQRYVHGGYVGAWRHGDRCLTGAITRGWSPFDGMGLPEMFEAALGWGDAQAGDEVIRIGVGRFRRHPKHREAHHQAARHCRITTACQWTVDERSDSHVVMSSGDEWSTSHDQHSYRLVRTVRLGEGVISSRTELRIDSHDIESWPIAWYAHPFFAHTAGEASRMHLPPGARLLPGSGGHPEGDFGANADPAGGWRFRTFGGRPVFAGLWGATGPMRLDLDPALGGGSVSIAVDRPLDHAVGFANRRAASIEPKLARTLLSGEQADWTVSYQFTG